MKKLLFIIALCPTTNMLAMFATRAAPIARIAAVISRSLHTTKKLADHQHSPTFPITSTRLSESYTTMRHQQEEKVREQLKVEARKEAEIETNNLEERYNALKITLELEKSRGLPTKAYNNLMSKIAESLMSGKIDITLKLGDRLAQIDKEQVQLSKETEVLLKYRFNA